MKKKLQLLSVDDMSKLPTPEWLIEDFFAEKSTTLVYGGWGIGKSYMVLDMVLQATTGGDWFGRKIARPLKTLFVVAEGASWWYRRIAAFERVHGPVDQDMIRFIPEPVNLWGTDQTQYNSFEALEELVAEYQPDLLIIDTWIRCTGAFGLNEDKSTDTAFVYSRLERLRENHNVTPVIVHHPTKDGQTSRGSGNLEASVERVISVSKANGSNDMDRRFVVEAKKGNHIKPFVPFELFLETVAFGDEEDQKAAVVYYNGDVSSSSQTQDKLYEVMEPGKLYRQADLKKLNVIPAGSVSHALKQLEEAGKVEKRSTNYIRIRE